MFLLGFRHIRTRSNGFSKIHAHLNLGPNVTFGSSCGPDFELNCGQVQRSSGSNRGSEPNYGSTSFAEVDLENVYAMRAMVMENVLDRSSCVLLSTVTSPGHAQGSSDIHARDCRLKAVPMLQAGILLKKNLA